MFGDPSIYQNDPFCMFSLWAKIKVRSQVIVPKSCGVGEPHYAIVASPFAKYLTEYLVE